MKRRRIIEQALWAGLILVVAGGALIGCENRMIYFPHKYPEGNWQVEQAGLEDVWFESGDGTRLHGWYLATPDARATLLWFHGNAGNITHRLENMRRLQSLGLNIFIFDYRGYGRSEGSPDEKGLRLDAQAAYDALVKKRSVAPESLILFGRSLGGFFASDVAKSNPAVGLILESTFTSASDMANHMFFTPVGGIIRAKLDTVERVPHIALPKLFLHGTEDTIVPYALGRKLFEAAAEPKEFYDIKGADHNDTWMTGGDPYFEALDRFITRVLKVPKPGKPPAQD